MSKIIKRLIDFHKIAKDICHKKDATNLILQGELNIDEFLNPLENIYENEAKDWQSPTRPKKLYFSHGEYIHKYGDGIKGVIEELKRKPDSNRSLISLINMSDIIGSGDRPIPSFIIIQFGISGNKLFVTVYFRALEVHEFLPINLTEISLIIQKIRNVFPQIQKVYLTIHAFKAHSMPGFTCLKRSSIDMITGAEIGLLVAEGDKQEIARLLEDKKNETTVVEVDNLKQLLIAVQKSKRKEFNKKFIESLASAINDFNALREIRKSASRSDEKLKEKIKEELEKAIHSLY